MAMTHPGDVTLATYEAAAQRYVNQVPASPSGALIAFLDRLAELVGTRHVLELGSGPGWDATYLEDHGLRVTRTDAALAFVERMRTAGHEARRLDVCTDELAGPYDAVLADALLLHLSRDDSKMCCSAPAGRSLTTGCWCSRSRRATELRGATRSSDYPVTSPTGGRQRCARPSREQAGL